MDLKLIKGFKNYQISDDGRVWSIKRNIWLKPLIGGVGYHQVSLRKDGKSYMKCIHKLVAEAFIPNPNNYTEVDHIDTDINNNTVSNLRWCNRLMNNNNPLTRQHRSEASKGKHHTEDTKKKMSKLMTNNSKISKQVYQYTLDGELVAVWKSTMDCERNGFRHSEVGRCCNGTRGRITYKNYIWKYA